MTAREFSALISAVLITVGTIWYIVVSLKGTKVKPVLASWIILGGTMTLSFATYWTSPKHSLISNASNAASVISAIANLATAAYLERGRVFFSLFQKWCLWISAVITGFWVLLVWGFHGTGIIPNILTQVLMVVGCLVTAKKLWGAKRNTESLFTWWCITIASGIAFYTGVVSHDGLATLYATRATLTSGVIVWLMHRAEWRSRLARYLA